MLELLVNEQLGVTDDVDEENVTNFEFDVRHLYRRQSPNEISTSRAVCTISPFGGTNRKRLTASAMGTWRT